MLGIRPASALLSAVALAALTAGVGLVPAGVATVFLEPTTCDGEPITILGTPGNDTIHGTAGPDVIHGQGGSDVILGLGGDDVICDDAGSNWLRGGAGADRLFSTSFHALTRLSGGPGDDVLIGGPGDTVDYTLAAGPVTVDMRAGTADGEGSDTIARGTYMGVMGSAFDDTLLGGPDSNYLLGQGGADFIDGRGGADVIRADNQYDGDDGAVDRVIGGSGSDIVDLLPGGGPNVIDLRTRAGADPDSVVGTSDGSVLSLGAASDTVDVGGPVTVRAGAGDDYVTALGPGVVRVWLEDGDDQLWITPPTQPRALVDGGAGGDDKFTIHLPTGSAGGLVAVDLATPAIALPGQPSMTVQWSGIEAYVLAFHAEQQSVRLTGTPGRDVVNVTAGNITADLFGGDDELSANTIGTDWLRVHMGEGNDSLGWNGGPVTGDLGGGHDVARLGDSNDVVHGGDGNDEIYGYGGADYLYGGIGTDGLSGASGRDHLYGGLGSDLLRGRGDGDFLDGGDGADDGDGGVGTDQCVALETSVNCEG